MVRRVSAASSIGDSPGLSSVSCLHRQRLSLAFGHRPQQGAGRDRPGRSRSAAQARSANTATRRRADPSVRKPDFNFGASGGNLWQLRLLAPERQRYRPDHRQGLRARLDGVTRSSATASCATRRTIPTSTTATAFLRVSCCSNRPTRSSIRLIADYTYRNEKCCGAIYVDNSEASRIASAINNPSTPLSTGAIGTPPNVPQADGNNIINVLRDLSQPLSAFSRRCSRNLSGPRPAVSLARPRITAHRARSWDLGGATLTSITGYRRLSFRSRQGDLDYGAVDILYRAPRRQCLPVGFTTFTPGTAPAG